MSKKISSTNLLYDLCMFDKFEALEGTTFCSGYSDQFDEVHNHVIVQWNPTLCNLLEKSEASKADHQCPYCRGNAA